MAKAKQEENLFEAPTPQPPPAPAPKKRKVPKAPAASKQIVPIKPEARSLLAIIADAAANPSVNTEKMDALLRMQREIMHDEAVIAFRQAFIELQAELPEINKDGKIEIAKIGQKTFYATFENINRVCRPMLRQHGFGIWFESTPVTEGGVRVTCHLDHRAGHSISSTLQGPLDTSGSKQNIQGIGSSFAYLKRYSMIGVLNIQTYAEQDRDRDGSKPVEKITGPQAKAILKAIDECGVPVATFIDKFKVTAVHELPASQYDEAIKSCENYKKRQEAKDAKRA
jgi:hypothetical protein